MKLSTIGDNCMDVYSATGQMFPGGNPVNVAVYTVRLGGEASYTGAVGSDACGSLLCQALREKGVDVSHVHVLPGQTAATQISLRDRERIMGDYTEGVLLDYRPSEEDLDFLCQGDAVHTGLWSHMEHELPRLKRRVPVSFDFATQTDGPILEQALPWVDYAFFFQEADTPELRRFLQEVSRRGPRVSVATLGSAGSLAWDGTRFRTMEAVQTNVVDTMGAGDSFIAGFLFRLCQGADLDTCMRAGAENAAVTLQYMGAW